MDERVLAWRASRIHDPVERLRFLRARGCDVRRPVWQRAGRAVAAALALCCMTPARAILPETRPRHDPPPVMSAPSAAVLPRVWLVESTAAYELYSNGLRIETANALPHHRRSYAVFDGEMESRGDTPAGIVYHSTESHLIPFRPEHNDALHKAGESLVDYVRRRRAYHYVIDRFGRVERTVAEGDSADHAGNSVWAWDGKVCLNLNHAFMAVAFEARTGETLNPAQIHAGKVLTEMLRARYSIRAENCVTHAQVSVNPGNMRIGWHTDWARDFPFAQLGLPNNYEQPLASIEELGFTYDALFLDVAGEALWLGVHRAETHLKDRAAANGETPADWRRVLVTRYRDLARRNS